MSEVVGVAALGTPTSVSEILASSANLEIISVTLAGGVAASFAAGAALADTGTAGLKAKYTNGGAIDGACILLAAQETTVAGGAVVCEGMVAGAVKAPKVLDSAGAAVDAAFQAELNNVRFS